MALLPLIALITALLAQVAPPKGVPLGIRWLPSATVETGLTNLAGIAICPTPDRTGPQMVAVDSAGNAVELLFSEGNWKTARKFRVPGPVAIVTGAHTAGAQTDARLIVGTLDGRLLAARRGPLGWTHNDIAELPGPIRAIQATAAAWGGASSSVFVADGAGSVTEFVEDEHGEWRSGRLPTIPGGARFITFDYDQRGLRVGLVSPAGAIYRVTTDSLGNWGAAEWAVMQAPPKDVVASADPTMRDMAFFYSGEDGYLRYLFLGSTIDTLSRLVVGGGATHLIGKGDQRRFNEFFGMRKGTFSLFEYDAVLLDWQEIPITKIEGTTVATCFGPGRGELLHQIYVVTLEGRAYEFVRGPYEGEH
ncbi:MAG TPA: hypothetical protein VGB22_06020 [candidate division Zixibacteria bacterium]|jgi:hypothetical protein